MSRDYEHTNELNSLITDAIFEAEGALDEAIDAWKEVAGYEQEIADCIAHPDVDHDIAQRGVATAALTVDVLKALRGRKEGQG
jgi:hypothetical protein